MTAVGVDGSPDGWVAVALAADGTARGVHGPTLDAIVAQVPEAAGIGVDIPIGLPRAGPRRADVDARRLLGPRRSSVFLTPVREALEARTHAEASATARRRTGHGVSRQAYGLAGRILEADAWAPRAPVPVWEVHPEVCFAVLLGHPATASKKTWSGMRERLTALEAAGVGLADLSGTGRAAPHDVLDAAAVAWSAERLLRGQGGACRTRQRSTPRPGAPWRSGSEPTAAAFAGAEPSGRGCRNRRI